MNRLFPAFLIALAGLMAGCGSSVNSSTQAKAHDEYIIKVTPDQFTLNSGDWASISAVVQMTSYNGTPKAVSPQPTLKFYSSDARISVSSAGEVCAGRWDALYENCNSTESLGLPTGYVTITVYDAEHSVTGTTQVSVHNRAGKIVMSAPTYPASGCVSQNQQIKYVATAYDTSGNLIPNCANSSVAGCINDRDYTWSTVDSTVATAGIYGSMTAVDPGVTNVYATLNSTVSTPVAFATCPPVNIVIASSPFNNTTPTGPYTTADMDALNKGDQKYVTATLVDTNSNTMTTLPITFISSKPQAGSFATRLPLTSTFTANTSGRTSLLAACVPPNCNNSAPDFVPPGATAAVSAASLGFGYPIYSNLIGASVTGYTGSTVLVTGAYYSDDQTLAHKMEVFDSEAMTLTKTIVIANTPNSLVVAPNGAAAYLGSDAGLVVVNLSTYVSSVMTYPITGGLSTDVITGKVLGVSADSRYVVVSDTTNGLVFLIDTTGDKATRFVIPGITSVAFAADNSDFWLGGTSGVYVYQADTFVKTATNVSSNVAAMAWTPDGQSYFASGDQMVNYSTCNDGVRPSGMKVSTLTGNPISLATTSVNGIPHVLGLATSNSAWYDYTVASSSQIVNGAAGGSGNVCLSAYTVNTPTTAASTLQCTATQVNFTSVYTPAGSTSAGDSQAFVTGVDPSCGSAESVIHGYDVLGQQEVTLTTNSAVVPLSGGILSDGRKLFFGTYDSTSQYAGLHRVDLTTGTEDTITTTSGTALPISVDLVPSFVAVVPK